MANVGYKRETAESGTCIDVVYFSKIVENKIIKLAVSDYYTVQIKFSHYVKKSKPLKTTFLDWSVLADQLFSEKWFLR